MVRKKSCVFISGQGTNLKSLINNSRYTNFPINISLVICDNIKAPGILLAKKNSIPFLIIDTKKRNFENIILNQIKKHKISLICLAGYMKIISRKFILNFGNKIINIHPSLLPKFKGLNTFERILNENEIKTGCSVHFVNEKLDGGKIIIRKSFFIKKNYDIKILKNKTQRLEYLAYAEAIRKIYRLD